MTGSAAPFGWVAIARLGLVQMALGAIVVLTTSTLNRVMVVELALPALLPGLLVALHHAMQVSRPRMGHGSDIGGRRTPWIVGGMAVLAAGGTLAAVATAWMGSRPVAGTALAVAAFVLIGLGVSAAGTSLLVLLAKRVGDERRAAAATLVWVMMIVGFAVTAGLAGHWLDPYSPARLVAVMGGVCAIALAITPLALHGLEGPAAAGVPTDASRGTVVPFRDALGDVWADPVARRFTVFVFVSMLAFSAQDLILEPFAGTVYGYTPGQSTQLSGIQNGGVLAGMLLVAAAGSGRRGRRPGALRAWTVGGCIASAVALAALVAGGLGGGRGPLAAIVFALGAANGAFSIAAIGSMMQLATQGRGGREGVRMGLWGAAQAIAFALGGVLGTGAADIARWLIGRPGEAYATVFALEAAMFVVAAMLALRIGRPAADLAPRPPESPMPAAGPDPGFARPSFPR